MITFQQLCEYLTCKQRYSWFYLDKELYECLDIDEKSLVFLETTNDESLHRLWYPKFKVVHQPVNMNELRRQMNLAIESEDWARVKDIKERMKGQ